MSRVGRRDLSAFQGLAGAGGVLAGLAAILLLVATVTGRGDLTSATLVLVGVGALIGGLFLLAFTREEPLPTETAALLASQPVIDLARICADLGVQGSAHVVPTPDGPVQLIPVAADSPPPSLADDDYSFQLDEDGGAIRFPPTGLSLLRELEERQSLALPDTVAGVAVAIQEVGAIALLLADEVEALPEGEGLVVRLRGYRLIAGCRRIRAESPRACTMIGCPVCSLFACMAAQGTNRTCIIDQVTVDDKEREVRLALRLLS